MSDALDLSGPWYGRYAGVQVSGNSFIALVAERRGRLTGHISEPDDLGQAALRHATLNGQRAGSAVSFVKQYDGAVLAHAVTYMGILSTDGCRVAGTWSFERYSGTFVMERERFTREELEDDAELDAPVVREREEW